MGSERRGQLSSRLVLGILLEIIAAGQRPTAAVMMVE
jgi:hypothetical protein